MPSYFNRIGVGFEVKGATQYERQMQRNAQANLAYGRSLPIREMGTYRTVLRGVNQDLAISGTNFGRFGQVLIRAEQQSKTARLEFTQFRKQLRTNEVRKYSTEIGRLDHVLGSANRTLRTTNQRLADKGFSKLGLENLTSVSQRHLRELRRVRAGLENAFDSKQANDYIRSLETIEGSLRRITLSARQLQSYDVPTLRRRGRVDTRRISREFNFSERAPPRGREIATSSARRVNNALGALDRNLLNPARDVTARINRNSRQLDSINRQLQPLERAAAHARTNLQVIRQGTQSALNDLEQQLEIYGQLARQGDRGAQRRLASIREQRNFISRNVQIREQELLVAERALNVARARTQQARERITLENQTLRQSGIQRSILQDIFNVTKQTLSLAARNPLVTAGLATGAAPARLLGAAALQRGIPRAIRAGNELNENVRRARRSREARVENIRDTSQRIRGLSAPGLPITDNRRLGRAFQPRASRIEEIFGRNATSFGASLAQTLSLIHGRLGDIRKIAPRVREGFEGAGKAGRRLQGVLDRQSFAPPGRFSRGLDRLFSPRRTFREFAGNVNRRGERIRFNRAFSQANIPAGHQRAFREGFQPDFRRGRGRNFLGNVSGFRGGVGAAFARVQRNRPAQGDFDIRQPITDPSRLLASSAVGASVRGRINRAFEQVAGQRQRQVELATARRAGQIRARIGSAAPGFGFGGRGQVTPAIAGLNRGLLQRIQNREQLGQAFAGLAAPRQRINELTAARTFGQVQARIGSAAGGFGFGASRRQITPGLALRGQALQRRRELLTPRSGRQASLFPVPFQEEGRLGLGRVARQFRPAIVNRELLNNAAERAFRGGEGIRGRFEEQFNQQVRLRELVQNSLDTNLKISFAKAFNQRVNLREAVENAVRGTEGVRSQFERNFNVRQRDEALNQRFSASRREERFAETLRGNRFQQVWNNLLDRVERLGTRFGGASAGDVIQGRRIGNVITAQRGGFRERFENARAGFPPRVQRARAGFRQGLRNLDDRFLGITDDAIKRINSARENFREILRTLVEAGKVSGRVFGKTLVEGVQAAYRASKQFFTNATESSRRLLRNAGLIVHEYIRSGRAARDISNALSTAARTANAIRLRVFIRGADLASRSITNIRRTFSRINRAARDFRDTIERTRLVFGNIKITSESIAGSLAKTVFTGGRDIARRLQSAGQAISTPGGILDSFRSADAQIEKIDNRLRKLGRDLGAPQDRLRIAQAEFNLIEAKVGESLRKTNARIEELNKSASIIEDREEAIKEIQERQIAPLKLEIEIIRNQADLAIAKAQDEFLSSVNPEAQRSGFDAFAKSVEEQRKQLDTLRNDRERFTSQLESIDAAVAARSSGLQAGFEAQRSKLDANLKAKQEKLNEDIAAREIGLDEDIAARKAKLQADNAARQKKLDEDNAARRKKLNVDLVKDEGQRAKRRAKLDADIAARQAKLDADIAARQAKLDADIAAKRNKLAPDIAARQAKLDIESRTLRENLDATIAAQTANVATPQQQVRRQALLGDIARVNAEIQNAEASLGNVGAEAFDSVQERIDQINTAVQEQIRVRNQNIASAQREILQNRLGIQVAKERERSNKRLQRFIETREQLDERLKAAREDLDITKSQVKLKEAEAAREQTILNIRKRNLQTRIATGEGANNLPGAVGDLTRNVQDNLRQRSIASVGNQLQGVSDETAKAQAQFDGFADGVARANSVASQFNDEIATTGSVLEEAQVKQQGLARELRNTVSEIARNPVESLFSITRVAATRIVSISESVVNGVTRVTLGATGIIGKAVLRITSTLTKIPGRLLGIIPFVGEGLRSIFDLAHELFSTLLSTIGRVGIRIATGVVGIARNIFTGLYDTGRGVVEGLASIAEEAIRNALERGASILQTVFGTVTDLARRAAGVYIDALRGVRDAIQGVFEGYANAIISSLRDIFNRIRGIVIDVAKLFIEGFTAPFRFIRNLILDPFTTLRNVIVEIGKLIRNVILLPLAPFAVVITAPIRALGFVLNAFNFNHVPETQKNIDAIEKQSTKSLKAIEKQGNVTNQVFDRASKALQSNLLSTQSSGHSALRSYRGLHEANRDYTGSTVQSIRAIDDIFRIVSQGADSLTTSVSSLRTSFSNLALGATGALAILGGVLAAGKRADSFKGIIRAFQQTGIALKDLQRASGETLRDIDAMRATNIALSNTPELVRRAFATNFSEINESSHEALQAFKDTLGEGVRGSGITSIMEIARQQAIRTGSSTQFLFESLTSGIKRSSPKLIDNTGLVIKIGRANETFANALGKSVKQLTATETQLALLAETVRAGQAGLEDISSETEGARQKFERFTAQLGNVADRVTFGLQPALEGFLNFMNRILFHTRQFSVDIASALYVGTSTFTHGISTLFGDVGNNLRLFARNVLRLIGIDFQETTDGAVQAMEAIFFGGVRVFATLAGTIAGIWEVIKGTIEGALQDIADILVGRSPPPKGPLKNIDKGGAAVARAWQEGFVGVNLRGFESYASQVGNIIGRAFSLTGIPRPSEFLKDIVAEAEARFGDLDVEGIEDRIEALDRAIQPFETRLGIVRQHFDAIQAAAQHSLDAINRQINDQLQAVIDGSSAAAEQVRTLDQLYSRVQRGVALDRQPLDQAEISIGFLKAQQAEERALLEIARQRIEEQQKGGEEEEDAASDIPPQLALPKLDDGIFLREGTLDFAERAKEAFDNAFIAAKNFITGQQGGVETALLDTEQLRALGITYDPNNPEDFYRALGGAPVGQTQGNIFERFFSGLGDTLRNADTRVQEEIIDFSTRFREFLATNKTVLSVEQAINDALGLKGDEAFSFAQAFDIAFELATVKLPPAISDLVDLIAGGESSPINEWLREQKNQDKLEDYGVLDVDGNGYLTLGDIVASFPNIGFTLIANVATAWTDFVRKVSAQVRAEQSGGQAPGAGLNAAERFVGILFNEDFTLNIGAAVQFTWDYLTAPAGTGAGLSLADDFAIWWNDGRGVTDAALGLTRGILAIGTAIIETSAKMATKVVGLALELSFGLFRGEDGQLTTLGQLVSFALRAAFGLITLPVQALIYLGTTPVTEISLAGLVASVIGIDEMALANLPSEVNTFLTTTLPTELDNAFGEGNILTALVDVSNTIRSRIHQALFGEGLLLETAPTPPVPQRPSLIHGAALRKRVNEAAKREREKTEELIKKYGSGRVPPQTIIAGNVARATQREIAIIEKENEEVLAQIAALEQNEIIDAGTGRGASVAPIGLAGQIIRGLESIPDQIESFLGENENFLGLRDIIRAATGDDTFELDEWFADARRRVSEFLADPGGQINASLTQFRTDLIAWAKDTDNNVIAQALEEVGKIITGNPEFDLAETIAGAFDTIDEIGRDLRIAFGTATAADFIAEGLPEGFAIRAAETQIPKSIGEVILEQFRQLWQRTVNFVNAPENADNFSLVDSFLQFISGNENLSVQGIVNEVDRVLAEIQAGLDGEGEIPEQTKKFLDALTIGFMGVPFDAAVDTLRNLVGGLFDRLGEYFDPKNAEKRDLTGFLQAVFDDETLTAENMIPRIIEQIKRIPSVIFNALAQTEDFGLTDYSNVVKFPELPDVFGQEELDKQFAENAKYVNETFSGRSLATRTRILDLFNKRSEREFAKNAEVQRKGIAGLANIQDIETVQPKRIFTLAPFFERLSSEIIAQADAFFAEHPIGQGIINAIRFFSGDDDFDFTQARITSGEILSGKKTFGESLVEYLNEHPNLFGIESIVKFFTGDEEFSLARLIQESLDEEGGLNTGGIERIIQDVIDSITGDVRFRDVAVSYPGGKAILHSGEFEFLDSFGAGTDPDTIVGNRGNIFQRVADGLAKAANDAIQSLIDFNEENSNILGLDNFIQAVTGIEGITAKTWFEEYQKDLDAADAASKGKTLTFPDYIETILTTVNRLLSGNPDVTVADSAPGGIFQGLVDAFNPENPGSLAWHLAGEEEGSFGKSLDTFVNETLPNLITELPLLFDSIRSAFEGLERGVFNLQGNAPLLFGAQSEDQKLKFSFRDALKEEDYLAVFQIPDFDINNPIIQAELARAGLNTTQFVEAVAAAELQAIQDGEGATIYELANLALDVQAIVGGRVDSSGYINEELEARRGRVRTYLDFFGLGDSETSQTLEELSVAYTAFGNDANDIILEALRISRDLTFTDAEGLREEFDFTDVLSSLFIADDTIDQETLINGLVELYSLTPGNEKILEGLAQEQALLGLDSLQTFYFDTLVNAGLISDNLQVRLKTDTDNPFIDIILGLYGTEELSSEDASLLQELAREQGIRGFTFYQQAIFEHLRGLDLVSADSATRITTDQDDKLIDALLLAYDPQTQSLDAAQLETILPGWRALFAGLPQRILDGILVSTDKTVIDHLTGEERVVHGFVGTLYEFIYEAYKVDPNFVPPLPESVKIAPEVSEQTLEFIRSILPRLPSSEQELRAVAENILEGNFIPANVDQLYALYQSAWVSQLRATVGLGAYQEGASLTPGAEQSSGPIENIEFWRAVLPGIPDDKSTLLSLASQIITGQSDDIQTFIDLYRQELGTGINDSLNLYDFDDFELPYTRQSDFYEDFAERHITDDDNSLAFLNAYINGVVPPPPSSTTINEAFQERYDEWREALSNEEYAPGAGFSSTASSLEDALADFRFRQHDVTNVGDSYSSVLPFLQDIIDNYVAPPADSETATNLITERYNDWAEAFEIAAGNINFVELDIFGNPNETVYASGSGRGSGRTSSGNFAAANESASGNITFAPLPRPPSSGFVSSSLFEDIFLDSLLPPPSDEADERIKTRYGEWSDYIGGVVGGLIFDGGIIRTESVRSYGGVSPDTFVRQHNHLTDLFLNDLLPAPPTRPQLSDIETLQGRIQQWRRLFHAQIYEVMATTEADTTPTATRTGSDTTLIETLLAGVGLDSESASEQGTTVGASYRDSMFLEMNTPLESTDLVALLATIEATEGSAPASGPLADVWGWGYNTADAWFGGFTSGVDQEITEGSIPHLLATIRGASPTPEGPLANIKIWGEGLGATWMFGWIDGVENTATDQGFLSRLGSAIRNIFAAGDVARELEGGSTLTLSDVLNSEDFITQTQGLGVRPGSKERHRFAQVFIERQVEAALGTIEENRAAAEDLANTNITQPIAETLSDPDTYYSSETDGAILTAVNGAIASFHTLISGLFNIDTLFSDEGDVTEIEGELFSYYGSVIGQSFREGMFNEMNTPLTSEHLDLLIATVQPAGSPPAEGPLSEIDMWGKSIGQAWVDGFVSGINQPLERSHIPNLLATIEAFSPPREGPLSNIHAWGLSTGEEWVAGFTSSLDTESIGSEIFRTLYGSDSQPLEGTGLVGFGDLGLRLATEIAESTAEELPGALGTALGETDEEEVGLLFLTPEEAGEYGTEVGQAFRTSLAEAVNVAFTEEDLSSLILTIAPAGSPPAEGPLSEIDKWGESIGQAWIDGFATPFEAYFAEGVSGDGSEGQAAAEGAENAVGAWAKILDSAYQASLSFAELLPTAFASIPGKLWDVFGEPTLLMFNEIITGFNYTLSGLATAQNSAYGSGLIVPFVPQEEIAAIAVAPFEVVKPSYLGAATGGTFGPGGLIVGEEGPELIVPSERISVFPNQATRGLSNLAGFFERSVHQQPIYNSYHNEYNTYDNRSDDHSQTVIIEGRGQSDDNILMKMRAERLRF